MAIELRELRLGDKGSRRTLRDFLEVAALVYAGDPAWVRPLDMDLTDRLNPKKNPFFEHAEATGWVAYRDGKAVGRITAQVDHEHLLRHRDDAGFFGFFDTIDDPEVAQALLDAASRWVESRGMKRLRGPFSLSINEESGCLVEGFDTPPMILMPHHRPHQARLLEAAGFGKVKDLYAWSYTVGELSTRVQRAHEEVASMPEVSSRTLDMKDLDAEVRTVMSIFNDAWSDNWGFVPATERECSKMAADLKLILMPELTRLLFIEGEPAGVAIALPDVNALIADLDGKLLPFGFAKLLWRLRVAGPKRARLFILGIRKKWRHVRRYAGLSAFLYVEMNRAGQLLGIEGGELSWTLEDNGPINTAIKLMGGRVYKTYRVFERELGGSSQQVAPTA